MNAEERKSNVVPWRAQSHVKIVSRIKKDVHTIQGKINSILLYFFSNPFFYTVLKNVDHQEGKIKHAILNICLYLF